MKRRPPGPAEPSPLDVIRARHVLRGWQIRQTYPTAPGVSPDREFAALDVVKALRALTRPLTDSEALCLELADTAGV